MDSEDCAKRYIVINKHGFPTLLLRDAVLLLMISSKLKHMFKCIIMPLFIVLLFSSCTKTSSTAQEICIDEVCIDGEWNWIESYGSIAGLTISPQTEMQTRKVSIDDTHYREYLDGELILEKAYEYVKSDELNTFTTDSLILKLTDGNWYAVFNENSNLILTEPCADCWTHTYEKE